MTEDVEQDTLRSSANYPAVFPVSVSHTQFPQSSELFEASGLPYGAVLTPFIGREDLPLSHSLKPTESSEDVDRCKSCGAYMNPFCNSNSIRWSCALCGCRNDVSVRGGEGKHRGKYC